MRQIVYIFLAVLLQACVTVQQATLPDEQPLAQYEPGSSNTKPSVNVLNVNNGVLADFSSGISNWSTEFNNISLGRKNGSLLIKTDEAGPGWEKVVWTFPKPYDFSHAPNLLVKARTAVDAPTYASLRIELVDVNGYHSNANIFSARVVPGESFDTYPIIMEGGFEQGWPKKAMMDQTKIMKAIIYINAGGPAFSGKVYIDQIQAVQNPWKHRNASVGGRSDL